MIIRRVNSTNVPAVGNAAHEFTGKQVFNTTSPHAIVIDALARKPAAEALARRLWMSFVVEGKDSLFPDDLVDVLGHARRTEAEESFAALDRDANGDISLDEMVQMVQEIGAERHSIASSMHDVDQAIKVLDRLLCTVVLIVCIFVMGRCLDTYLPLFGHSKRYPTADGTFHHHSR